MESPLITWIFIRPNLMYVLMVSNFFRRVLAINIKCKYNILRIQNAPHYISKNEVIN